jgi:hypothetical protein
VKLVFIVVTLIWSLLVVGCSSESNADDSLPPSQIEFNISSSGSQSDIQQGILREIRNHSQFSELIQSMPSMSGDIPLPNFDNIHMVAIQSSISSANCSGLNVISVTDTEYTRTIEVEEVVTVNPGLCDPSPEAFSSNKYLLIEFEQSNKPISVVYSYRENF